MKTKRNLIIAAVAIAAVFGIFLLGTLYGAHQTNPRVKASRFLDRPEFAGLPDSAHELMYQATRPGTAPGPLRLLSSFGDVDITVSFRAHLSDVQRFLTTSPCLKDVEPEVDDTGGSVYDIQKTKGPGSGWVITVSPDRKGLRIHFWSEFT